MLPAAFHDHYELARARAFRLCQGHLDYEDLAQDAIERWLRALPGLPLGTNHAAWLSTVVRNLFVDRLRRAGARRQQSIDGVRLFAPNPEPPPWWRELGADEIDRALARLPGPQRQTLRLFALEGKSYLEIARRQGITASTVGTRILRGRLRLRAILEAGGRRARSRGATSA